MSEKNMAVIRLLAGKVQGEQANRDAAVLARYYSDNGADEILVFDLSDGDVDHDLSIGALKEKDGTRQHGTDKTEKLRQNSEKALGRGEELPNEKSFCKQKSAAEFKR